MKITDYLPTGKENAIPSKTLAEILGFDTVRELQKAIERERQAGAVILSTCTCLLYTSGFAVQDVTFSPIKGPEGNIEFLGYLAKRGVESVPDLKEVVRQAHAELDG